LAGARTMRALRITLIVLAVVLVGILVGGYVYYRDLTRGPLPQHEGELSVAGLHDTVEVLRDEWGIPHIYASDLHDLFLAQGYTQAQDRWWQMEFWRHIGSGRIEEVTGRDDDLLAADILIRSLGWRRVAEQEAELCNEEAKAHLQAFADGVNAYTAERRPGDLALEYGVLGLTGKSIEVEPWTPADSLVWGKVMAWELGPGGNTEETRSTLYEVIGQEMTDLWMTPPWPYGERPTIVQSSVPATEAPTDAGGTAGETELAYSYRGGTDSGLGTLGIVFGAGRGAGSNNWVASGNMTESGLPLLANDPHLGIQLPSIWYEIGLHCQPADGGSPLDVVGFTFVPIPGVVIGHNGQIAWGVTNTGPDVSDLYQIRVNPDNPFQYDWNGEWRDMTVRSETFQFAGGADPITVQVRETHLGPIINDNEVDEETGELLGFNNEDPLALRWTASEPGTMTEAVFSLNTAGNWDDFRSALEYWDAPSQNFVYADVEGNIGYQMPGRIPIRAADHSGLVPVPGWTDEFEWQGYVPFELLPSVLNPEEGYVATANQAVVPPEYYDELEQELGEGRNYVFSREWDYGYRAERIMELLEQGVPQGIESFQMIQGDNRLLSADDVMPYLADLSLDDAELADARDWLLEWDRQFAMGSPQAALYAQVWSSLVNNLFNDEIAVADLEDEFQAYGSDSDMQAVSLLLGDPGNPWWDDAATDEVVETRDDILLRAFEEGYSNAVDDLGGDRETWSWGGLHRATFVSRPLGASGVGLVERMVNRGPFEVGGTTAAINNTVWAVGSDEEFEMLWLPSMRMIVDLSDLTRSVAVNATGQSGHPYSPQYDDMIDEWRNIQYHTMLWTRQQVEEAAVARLILLPG
jgi:penicillin amidase